MGRFTGDSEGIRNLLGDLLLDEKRMLAEGEIKKPLKANHYRRVIAERLGFNDDTGPSLRSYEVWIQELRRAIKEDNPLDEMWTAGACLQYGISPDVIPILATHKAAGLEITIRQARWLSTLYPVLDLMVGEEYPNLERLIRAEYVVEIADQYARLEQIAHMMGKPHADTTVLDDRYFVRKDFSAKSMSDGWEEAGLSLRRLAQALVAYAPQDPKMMQVVQGIKTDLKGDPEAKVVHALQVASYGGPELSEDDRQAFLQTFRESLADTLKNAVSEADSAEPSEDEYRVCFLEVFLKAVDIDLREKADLEASNERSSGQEVTLRGEKEMKDGEQ